jgi:type II secretory pathway pseudopilin PulG
MKKLLQSILGVTLLEIMLVLAIAAMVIVMSIRYYQSASNNQKIAAGLNAVTGIIAAGESVLGAKGSLATVASDALPYLPNGALPNSPWGGQMTIQNGTATSYKISMPITANPPGVCAAFQSLIQQNSKITAACGGGVATITVQE